MCLVIGTLYCTRRSYDFGLSLIMSVFTSSPNSFVDNDSWHFLKRCILALVRDISIVDGFGKKVEKKKEMLDKIKPLTASLAIFLETCSNENEDISETLGRTTRSAFSMVTVMPKQESRRKEILLLLEILDKLSSNETSAALLDVTSTSRLARDRGVRNRGGNSSRDARSQSMSSESREEMVIMREKR